MGQAHLLNDLSSEWDKRRLYRPAHQLDRLLTRLPDSFWNKKTALNIGFHLAFDLHGT